MGKFEIKDLPPIWSLKQQYTNFLHEVNILTKILESKMKSSNIFTKMLVILKDLF